jgi:hypothetical protein
MLRIPTLDSSETCGAKSDLYDDEGVRIKTGPEESGFYKVDHELGEAYCR